MRTAHEHAHGHELDRRRQLPVSSRARRLLEQGAVKLVGRLGREVWLAHHPMYGSVVYKRATEREIQLTMLAGHVIEAGADHLIMERVDGEPLDVRVRREGRLRVRDALAIARDVARTLATLHARGIVHRDVKPENIVGATLIDFGSASAPGVGERASATPAYMAPEQRDRHAVVDARADVYAFGGTLFAMLVGRAHEGRRLRDVLAGCSPELDAFVTRCLARNAVDRFASGAELEIALARIPDHDVYPLVAPALPRATTTLSASALAFQTRSERRASPALIGLVAVAAMLVSIATGLRIAKHTTPPSVVASMSDFAPAAQPIVSLAAVGACYR
jgi:eukaryotic-like serine/threonine-protein kinase